MGELVIIQQINKIRGPADRPTVLIDTTAVIGVRVEPVSGRTVRVVLLLPGHEVQLPATPHGMRRDEFDDVDQAMQAVQRLLPERFGNRTADWLDATRVSD